MKIAIYADGSNKNEIFDLYANNKTVKGFTTNPSLMKKAGVVDYFGFVKDVTSVIKDLPISFEVFADDFEEMYRQAILLSECGENVFVKIPITNTKKETSLPLVERLLNKQIKVNITAVTTQKQIEDSLGVSNYRGEVILSIFAGRIADTGVDPKPFIDYAVKNKTDNVKVLWASPREVFNVYEADSLGCDIITMTGDLINKLSLKNKDLEEYSLDTVKMFYKDAQSAGYKL